MSFVLGVTMNFVTDISLKPKMPQMQSTKPTDTSMTAVFPRTSVLKKLGHPQPDF